MRSPITRIPGAARRWLGARALASIVLAAGLAPGVGDAAVLQPWQQWASSSFAANLDLIPGTGDFTGDGAVDIAVYKTSSFPTSTRRIWIGRNTGTSFSFCAAGGAACIASNTEAVATLTGCSDYQFYTGNFAGDARPDIVVYDGCLGEVRVLVNNAGVFGLTGPMATTAPASGWKLIAGDFAGDSLTDVMVYHPEAGPVGSLYVGRNAIFGFVWAYWGGLDDDGTRPPWQFFPGEFNDGGKLDILAFRPGGPTPAGTTNMRVGRNAGASFSFEDWHNLYPAQYQLPAPACPGPPSVVSGTGVTLVVANFTGTTTADVGVRTVGAPGDFGECYPDFSVLRNADQTFLESPNWTNLDPEDGLWQFATGNVVATGTSAGLTDLIAYYPGDGTFWVAENRGLPPEGYAWPTSVAAGQTLDLYFSGTLLAGQDNILIRRVTADGAGVLVADPLGPAASLALPSSHRPIRSGGQLPLNGPRWAPHAFPVPSDWIPGFYTATLKAQDGLSDFEIPFVVKPPAGARHRTALIANINTWNAYNNWGKTQKAPYGSKYSGESSTTFMRPNPFASLQLGVSPAAIGFSQTHLAHAEAWALTAIESIDDVGRGNVDVYSDLDLHDGVEIQAGTGPGLYDRLILTTHPEYWSTQMYDNLKSFLDQGGSLLYLGGNGIFESTSFITAPLGGDALHFPGALGPDPELEMAYRVPYLFRVMDHVNGVPPRAERKLLGIAFHDQPGDVAYVVKPHPTDAAELEVFDSILQGVVSPGDTGVDREVGTTGLIGRASGHEIDKLALTDGFGNVTNQVQAGFPDPLLPEFKEKDTTPSGIVWLAEGLNHGADITFYRYPDPPGDDPGRGFVFSTGSINFGQSMLVDTRLKQMVANVLLPACGNDLDDDGDGLYDVADPGCAASTDTSERSATLPCDDGADNDGDGGADYDPATLADPSAGGGDPGCKDPLSAREDPKCQNGLDDDGAPGTDFDAGVSILGPGGADPNGPDPQCLNKPWRDKEAPNSCGLGAELILLLVVGPHLWRRSRPPG